MIMSAYAEVFLCDVKDGKTKFVLTNINLLRSRNIIQSWYVVRVSNAIYSFSSLLAFCLFLKSGSFDQKYVKTHESDHFTGTFC